MITKKTAEDMEKLRVAGKHLARVLDAVQEAVAPGVSTVTLNEIAEQEIRALGDVPAFLGYQPQGAPRPFPAALCVAPNNVVVHGIPTMPEVVLKEGDIVGIDSGLVHEGMIVDAGRTVAVGAVDEAAEKLMNITREALAVGIKAAQPGARVGDIGAAIEAFVRPHGFGIVEVLCGHGVGYQVHEEPQVPNFGTKGTGATLEPGMVIAIEPMLNEGSNEVRFLPDGYTVETRDGKRSAHFEHTVAIVEKGPEVMTK